MLIIFILAFNKDEKSIFPLYYCILCFPFQKDESVIKMFRAAKRFRKRLTLTRHKSRHNAILAFTLYTKYEILLGWIVMMTLISWTAKSKAHYYIYLLMASTFSPNGPFSSTLMNWKIWDDERWTLLKNYLKAMEFCYLTVYIALLPHACGRPSKYRGSVLKWTKLVQPLRPV